MSPETIEMHMMEWRARLRQPTARHAMRSETRSSEADAMQIEAAASAWV